jgi:transcriptional regulator with XRE-family HTH domain
MNFSRNSVVELPLTADAQGRPRPTRLYSVAVNAAELRHQMRVRGLTGAELARRANVSPATISHALNGRRIHPAKFRKIATELHKAEPMPGVDALIQRESNAEAEDGGLIS